MAPQAAMSHEPSAMAIIRKWSLLDVAAIVLPVWLLLLISHTSADADLWGHLRFGSDLLRGSGLPWSDPYSFTSDVRWINNERLSEALMAAAFGAAGAAGLNFLKLSVIAIVGVIVWRTARDANASTGSSAVLMTTVLFVSYTRTQVLRPQLFSVLVFALLVHVLRRSVMNAPRRWIAIPALFCLWANLHGAWIVGFAVLCVWLTCESIERPSAAGAAGAGGLMLASGLATAVNPYGFAQWSFLRDTVGLSRADITDWAPFVALPAGIILIDSILPLLALAACAVRRQLPGPRDAAVIAILIFGTLRVGRVDAFLQIAIGLLLAPAIVDLFNRGVRWLSRFDRLTAKHSVNALAAAAVVTVAVVDVAPQLTRIAVEGPWIPDREAVRFLRTDSPHTRLLTWFDWGEYAIWHLAGSGIRVSMDGRRETVYSPRVLNDHWAFYRNDPDAWLYADRIRADRIWLPRDMPIVATLRERGWNVAFESDRSIVLTRERTRPLVAASHDTSPHLFPAE
jgi:hypothetical protein